MNHGTLGLIHLLIFTGLCEFAEMFPSNGSESCFQREVKKEEEGIVNNTFKSMQYSMTNK